MGSDRQPPAGRRKSVPPQLLGLAGMVHREKNLIQTGQSLDGPAPQVEETHIPPQQNLRHTRRGPPKPAKTHFPGFVEPIKTYPMGGETAGTEQLDLTKIVKELSDYHGAVGDVPDDTPSAPIPGLPSSSPPPLPNAVPPTPQPAAAPPSPVPENQTLPLNFGPFHVSVGENTLIELVEQLKQLTQKLEDIAHGKPATIREDNPPPEPKSATDTGT